MYKTSNYQSILCTKTTTNNNSVDGWKWLGVDATEDVTPE